MLYAQSLTGVIKSSIRRCFLYPALFFGASLAWGSETYNLKELLQKSEKNAALQKDLNALHRMAEAKLAEMQALKWLPSVELKMIGGIVPDATVDLNNVNTYRAKDLENDFSLKGMGGFWRVEVEALQPIYTFGKISNAIEAAKGGKELARAEQQKKINDLQLMVKKAYYTLQLTNDSLEILGDVRKKLDEAKEKVEGLLIKNAENVSEIDRLKIRVFLADVENRFLDADRGQRLSRAALNELAGLSGDWTLEQKNLVAEKPNGLKKEDAIGFALRSKPEILQLNELVQMKEAEARALRANLLPTFFVGGKLEYAMAPGRTDVTNPYLNDPFNLFNFGVVLGLKQDLSFVRTVKKVDYVKAEADHLAAQRDQLVIKTKLEVERSFEEAFSALQGVQKNEEGFRAARSWLTATGLSFNLGTSETKDLLESFAAYFKGRVDLMKSVYSLNLALAELSQTSGVEVLNKPGL